jgi:hypothetical protein
MKLSPSRRISTKETDFEDDLELPKKGMRVVDVKIISNR